MYCKRSIIDVVKESNEIKSITSKKNNMSKLSIEGEEVNFKIIVKTGSLEKEIDLKLNVIIENQKVKQVNNLVKYPKFLDDITKEIKADGIKRVSNLIAVIRTVIEKNDLYKAIFNGIKYDIVNDKNDDEIIANGLKILNLNFNFTENSKLISSSAKLNFNLQGKSRKEINQYLVSNLFYSSDLLIFGNWKNYAFFDESIFADKSTYKDLIDKLILFTSENNIFRDNIFRNIDNSESKISIDFKIEGKTNEELNEQIIISEDKWWEEFKVNLQIFIGSGQDKYKVNKLVPFYINIMKENYVQKSFVLHTSRLGKMLAQELSKYKLKTKIGNLYGKLRAELTAEIDRIIKLEDISYIRIKNDYEWPAQNDKNVISKENLIEKLYYNFRISFRLDKSIITDSLLISQWLWFDIAVEEN